MEKFAHALQEKKYSVVNCIFERRGGSKQRENGYVGL